MEIDGLGNPSKSLKEASEASAIQPDDNPPPNDTINDKNDDVSRNDTINDKYDDVSKDTPAPTLLPVDKVYAIMRKALPQNAKVSDGARAAVQECASRYIAHVTAEAARSCEREMRKTVRPDDVILANDRLGFKSFVRPLMGFLRAHKGMKEGTVRVLVQEREMGFEERKMMRMWDSLEEFLRNGEGFKAQYGGGDAAGGRYRV